MVKSSYAEAVEKYLKKYGLDKWKLETGKSKLFNNIVVVPAIAEYNNLQILINSLLKCSRTYFDSTLFVFVINNVLSASEEIKEDNKKSLLMIREMLNSSGEFAERIDKTGIQFGLVDVSSPGKEMDDKHGGVGLARKIGMDLALRYFDHSASAKRILVCLDADCTVSENYLDKIVETCRETDAHAGYARYEHSWTSGDKYADAIVCYEIFLRYYYLALKYADSPYAIHTIGSTLICTAEAYMKVEGMNKRKAAEDFYFIEKLAKIYDIIEIKDAVVYPSGRGSWRVPFGTGQRVNRFLAKEQDEYQLYSPESFTVLKSWNKYYYNSNNSDVADLLEYAQKLNPNLYNFLIQQSFEKQFKKIAENCSSDEQLLKQKKTWFDGFRTLKLIHYLRDNSFPNINMFDAVDELFSLLNAEKIEREKGDKIPEFSIQAAYLEKLRDLT